MGVFTLRLQIENGHEDIMEYRECYTDYQTDRQTDRQTDVLLTSRKVITDLFAIEMREICTYILYIQDLFKSKFVKSYDNIHRMKNKFEIMLSGIAILNTGYFDNTNDY